MKLHANCKINLGLRVLRRRADGFHDIETVMAPVVGLYDEISVEPYLFVPSTPPPFEAPPPPAFLPEDNLCMRALRLMQARHGIEGAVIGLRKNIPVGAGLGGGSADAAFTLRALDQEFNLGLSGAELEKLGAELGSDVPFFIRNTPQICTGRGEIMAPVEVDLRGLWIAILKPAASVSTAEAYAGVTPHEGGASVAEIIRRPVSEWREALVNDFEPSVFARHPEIGALKNELYGSGAIYASMSGSGSAVFGIFESHPTLAMTRRPFFVSVVQMLR